MRELVTKACALKNHVQFIHTHILSLSRACSISFSTKGKMIDLLLHDDDQISRNDRIEREIQKKEKDSETMPMSRNNKGRIFAASISFSHSSSFVSFESQIKRK